MDKKTIIITGASSRLGSALARQYASPHTRLFLFGRSQSRLKEIASICKTYQAEVVTIISDVRNKELTRSQIEEICEKYKVSILIACAGVSAGTLNKPETSKQVDIIFDTNINGNLNTIMPAIPFMVKNKALFDKLTVDKKVTFEFAKQSQVIFFQRMFRYHTNRLCQLADKGISHEASSCALVWTKLSNTRVLSEILPD